MLKRMPRTIAAEQSLKSGLFKLRDIAACAYGNGKWIQYRDAAGTCQLTMSMGEIVKNASLEDVEASKALAVLSTGTLPENGVKTMVILLVSLLEKAENLGCTEADVNAVMRFWNMRQNICQLSRKRITVSCSAACCRT